MIALAHNDGLLQELVVKWEPNLSKLVQSSIPKAAGRKPGPRRNCLSRAHEHSMSDPSPPEPYDVVLCRKQVRAYTPRGTVGLRFTLKPENIFFHLKRSCVQMKNSEGVSAASLLLSDTDKENLKTSHKIMIRKEFGVIVVWLSILILENTLVLRKYI